MTITGTGHRPDKLNYEWNGIGPVSSWLRSSLKATVNTVRGKTPLNDLIFISGMALGWDMIIAEFAIECNARLIAAIPCVNQSLKWPFTSRQRYDKILSYIKCTKVLIHNGRYNSTCMQNRNEWMIDEMLKDDSFTLIAAFDGSKGGTFNCIKYALTKNVNPIILDPRQKIIKRYN